MRKKVQKKCKKSLQNKKFGLPLHSQSKGCSRKFKMLVLRK